jgi:hypothetical protein
MRQPCHANAATLLQRVREENFDLWEFLIDPNYSKMDKTAATANF